MEGKHMILASWTWAWSWWSIVVVIGALNLGLGAYLFLQSKKVIDEKNSIYIKRMRIAGIVFLSVAMYRAVFVSRLKNACFSYTSLK